MVLRDFCQKIKTSRRRWPGYCGIAPYKVYKCPMDGGYLDGDRGIPDKEDDDRGDDKDQEQHSDTKRLLLVGSIKLVLYNVTGKEKLLD